MKAVKRSKRRGARGRKRAEDATIRFLKDGTVVVSTPSNTFRSKRQHPIGSTAWFLLHMLGLTAYDGDEFFLSAERTKP